MRQSRQANGKNLQSLHVQSPNLHRSVLPLPAPQLRPGRQVSERILPQRLYRRPKLHKLALLLAPRPGHSQGVAVVVLEVGLRVGGLRLPRVARQEKSRQAADVLVHQLWTELRQGHRLRRRETQQGLRRL